MSKVSNINTKFYCLVYLSQMAIVAYTEFLDHSLKFFFDLFNSYTESNSEEEYTKHLSLVVKRINIICKYCSEKKINIKPLLADKIETLFRLSHSKSLKLRIETLNLIFNIVKYLDGNLIDRYFRSLYELLLTKELSVSKSLRLFLKLALQSLVFDNNLNRVAAFLKRLLGVCLLSEPPFICCVLIVVSQVLRNKHKLWKMLETNKQTELYDNSKRDPAYTNANDFVLAELTILSNHYHPTIQKFVNFILANYNKDIVNYEGDPLLDFSLVNFLEKFILKNPKLAKKLKQKRTEDEKLLDFIEDTGQDQQLDDKGESLAFIKTFNEMIKNKKPKKAKKQLAEDDIEDFADKVIDEEYEKYDKQYGGDVDDDIGFDEI
jgi:hypothetical protein